MGDGHWDTRCIFSPVGTHFECTRLSRTVVYGKFKETLVLTFQISWKKQDFCDWSKLPLRGQESLKNVIGAPNLAPANTKLLDGVGRPNGPRGRLR